MNPVSSSFASWIVTSRSRYRRARNPQRCHGSLAPFSPRRSSPLQPGLAACPRWEPVGDHLPAGFPRLPGISGRAQSATPLKASPRSLHRRTGRWLGDWREALRAAVPTLPGRLPPARDPSPIPCEPRALVSRRMAKRKTDRSERRPNPWESTADRCRPRTRPVPVSSRLQPPPKPAREPVPRSRGNGRNKMWNGPQA